VQNYVIQDQGIPAGRSKRPTIFIPVEEFIGLVEQRVNLMQFLAWASHTSKSGSSLAAAASPGFASVNLGRPGEIRHRPPGVDDAGKFGDEVVGPAMTSSGRRFANRTRCTAGARRLHLRIYRVIHAQGTMAYLAGSARFTPGGIQAEAAAASDEPLFDVCDAHSQELHEIHSLLYEPMNSSTG